MRAFNSLGDQVQELSSLLSEVKRAKEESHSKLWLFPGIDQLCHNRYEDWKLSLKSRKSIWQTQDQGYRISMKG